MVDIKIRFTLIKESDGYLGSYDSGRNDDIVKENEN